MAIKDACRNIGFFYIKNHGISKDHIKAVFSEIKRFFDLPIEEKMKIHIGKSKDFPWIHANRKRADQRQKRLA